MRAFNSLHRSMNAVEKRHLERWRMLKLEKVTRNTVEIAKLKNLHFDTNVAILTKVF